MHMVNLEPLRAEKYWTNFLTKSIYKILEERIHSNFSKTSHEFFERLSQSWLIFCLSSMLCRMLAGYALGKKIDMIQMKFGPID